MFTQHFFIENLSCVLSRVGTGHQHCDARVTGTRKVGKKKTLSKLRRLVDYIVGKCLGVVLEPRALSLKHMISLNPNITGEGQT